MKHAYKLFLLFMASAVLFACTDENKTDGPSDPVWSFTNPAFSASGETLTVDLETATSIDLTWTAAVPTEDFVVSYQVDVMLDDAETSLTSYLSDEEGKLTSLSIDAAALDMLLEMEGFGPGAVVNGKLILKATCLDEVKNDELNFAITRKMAGEPTEFTSLYISGTASEAGDDITQAIAMKRLKDGAGEPTDEFEVYTQLNADGDFKFYLANYTPTYVYGASDTEGELALRGAAISVSETSVYRVRVNTTDKTYSLYKVERLGAIGGPLLGWGEDVPMEYQGFGVWKLNYNFQNDQNFVLRLNNDYGTNDSQVLKPLVGTNELMIGSDASELGLTQEDFFAPSAGAYIITADLSANGYTFSIEVNPDAGLTMPEALYLFEDGVKIHDFVKDEDNGIFSSGVYLALQSGKTYSVNSAADGSGTSYSLSDAISIGEGPDTWETRYTFVEGGAGTFTLDADNAYTVEYNFKTEEFKWRYHQMKLFHWDEAGESGGRDWNSKDEFTMQYVHPFKYKVTAALEAGYEMKFFCPWEVEFGAGTNDDLTALSGTMSGEGDRANFSNLTETGMYQVEIEVNNTFTGGTYNIVKQ